MEKNIGYFSAAFRDGRVHIANKITAAGYFCTHLLNQYYKNDTAARLSVFRQRNWKLTDMLSAGYINPPELERAGTEIGYLLDNLSLLHPFTFMDIESARNRITELFTEESGDFLADYFYRRGKVGQIDVGAASMDILPPEYDKELFLKAETMLSEIKSALRLYNSIGDDVQKAYKQLTAFVSRVDEADRFDEAHLLPLAYVIFGKVPLPIKAEYIPIKKAKNSKTLVTARKLYFDSYYSFIITDFFEGLHFGHYPRQCPVCNKYFLMKSARRQIYCNGYSNETQKNGTRLTCRQVGAMWQRNEKADADPVKQTYESRTGSIRVDKSRGNITEEFAKIALSLARDKKHKALQDHEYMKKQYIADMQKDKLYRDVAELLKK